MPSKHRLFSTLLYPLLSVHRALKVQLHLRFWEPLRSFWGTCTDLQMHTRLLQLHTILAMSEIYRSSNRKFVPQISLLIFVRLLFVSIGIPDLRGCSDKQLPLIFVFQQWRGDRDFIMQ